MPQGPGMAVCQACVMSPSGEHAMGVGEAAAGGRPAVRHGPTRTAAVVSVSPAERKPRGAAAAAHGAGTLGPAQRIVEEGPGQHQRTTAPKHQGAMAPDPGQSERPGLRWRTTRPGGERGPARRSVAQCLQKTTKKVAEPPGQWETGRRDLEQEWWWVGWRRGKRTHRTPHGER
jgi:hypothetical protein